MSTGVSVDDACVAKFNDIKLSKLKAKFVVYKIDGPMIVEEHCKMEGSFDDFLALIPEEDCRYALIDKEFTTNDGRTTSITDNLRQGRSRSPDQPENRLSQTEQGRTLRYGSIAEGMSRGQEHATCERSYL